VLTHNRSNDNDNDNDNDSAAAVPQSLTTRVSLGKSIIMGVVDHYILGATVIAMLSHRAVAPDTVQPDSRGSDWVATDGVVSEVVYSQTFDIHPGQIVLANDIPMPFLDEPGAIVNLASDLVDADTDESVPLSQAYMHHWILYGTSRRHSYRIPFGAGSEFRGLPGR
jgi:hypothetical protein